ARGTWRTRRAWRLRHSWQTGVLSPHGLGGSRAVWTSLPLCCFSRSIHGQTLAPAFSHVARSRWLIRRNQMVRTAADQPALAHAAQRLAQHRPVVGIVITEEGLVQAALPQPFGHGHLLAVARHAPQWILAAVIHGRRGRHGRRQKSLH